MSANVSSKTAESPPAPPQTDTPGLRINIYEGWKKRLPDPDHFSSFSCDRCYKLKKKCTRNLPSCRYCLKTSNECVYKRRRGPDAKTKARGAVRNEAELKIVMDPKTQPPVYSSKETEESEALQAARILQSQRENAARETSAARVAAPEPILQRIISEPSREGTSHKLVSISSLLTSDMEKTASVETLKKVDEKRKNNPINNRILVKSVVPDHSSNLMDELINLKEFPDEELPTNFIHNFFYNFENVYPFIDKEWVLTTVKTIDFKKESIVGLQIYMVMSIGCLIHDSLNNQPLFDVCFSEKIIESIIGIVNFNQRKCDEESDFFNLKLLLLLTLYSIYRCDEEMTWNLVGILDRLMIKFDFHTKPSKPSEFDRLKQQIFWSVFSLDKELSLLTEKPSQIPSNELISVDRLSTEVYPGGIFSEFIDFAYIQQQANMMKLRKGTGATQDLHAFSRLLDLWRVEISRLVRVNSNDFSINHLQEFTLLINLNYYYMNIEIDQISRTKSFQFTLQYISQAFSLAIINSDNTRNDKRPVALAMYSYFHLKRLVNVIKYSIHNLILLLDNSELSSKLPELSSNLQLMLNLINFIKEKTSYPPIKMLAEKLAELTSTVSKPEIIVQIQSHQATAINKVRSMGESVLDQI